MENKQLALEFAKFLLAHPISKCSGDLEHETYIPKEFKLLLGELIVHGDSWWERFIEYLNCQEEND